MARPNSTIKHYKVSRASATPGWKVFHAKDIASLRVKRGSRCGAQCVFVPNGNMGLKLYRNKWGAICAYTRQKRAARKHLAPPAGKLFFVTNRDGKTVRWGYETAIAKEPKTWNDTRGIRQLRKNLAHMGLFGLPINDIFKRQSTEHVATPRGTKGGHDIHCYNVGWYKGRLVCIDFGYHFIQNYESVAERLGGQSVSCFS